jgi:hypothetical protein
MNLVRIGAGLSHEFDVDTLFFWQPTLATSRKPRGPWETWLMRKGIHASGLRLVAMLRECASRVDRKLEPWEGTRFFPLHHIFDQQETDVFLDHFGHITEEANRIIAEEIARRLLPILERVDHLSTEESLGSRRQSGGKG